MNVRFKKCSVATPPRIMEGARGPPALLLECGGPEKMFTNVCPKKCSVAAPPCIVEGACGPSVLSLVCGGPEMTP